jgi:flagellar operon protein
MRIDLIAAKPIQSPTGVAQGTPATSPAPAESFDHLLRSTLERSQGLKWSAHAQQRLEARGIRLDGHQIARLDEAVGRADGKAVSRSLVLLDDLAFIVSVPSRTVITAIDEPRDGVFTNIDSAVIG